MNANKTALGDYLNLLYKIPLLTIEEEHKLAAMIKAGDPIALERLVKHNLRFVVSTVSNTPAWYNSAVPFEDLISMGNEAMLKAAKSWNPKPNIRFIAYAKSFINRGIRRGMDNEWALIRLPVNIGEEIRKMQYQQGQLLQRLGREPSDEEIAAAAGLHPSRLPVLRTLMMREPVSIEATMQDNIKEEDTE